jgi:hypothetical protein
VRGGAWVDVAGCLSGLELAQQQSEAVDASSKRKPANGRASSRTMPPHARCETESEGCDAQIGRKRRLTYTGCLERLLAAR